MELKMEIERLREEMIQTANDKGFENPEVIRISQELDALLNKYDEIRQSA